MKSSARLEGNTGETPESKAGKPSQEPGGREANEQMVLLARQQAKCEVI